MTEKRIDTQYVRNRAKGVCFFSKERVQAIDKADTLTTMFKWRSIIKKNSWLRLFTKGYQVIKQVLFPENEKNQEILKAPSTGVDEHTDVNKTEVT